MSPAEPFSQPRNPVRASGNIKKIGQAIKILFSKDSYLLENNSSERSITHKIALYLESQYPDYEVDCEYNLNAKDPRQRKTIYFDINTHPEVMNVRQGRRIHALSGDEQIELSIVPDIIIHKRGHNKNNCAIIEVKKSTQNPNEIAFDQKKLCYYTSEKCLFRYPAGYLIILNIGSEYFRNIIIESYSNGAMDKRHELIVRSSIYTKNLI